MVDRRGSRQSRGYGYAWEKLRKEVLDRDKHLCQCARCRKSGLITYAGEVDHIISKARAKALGWTQEQVDHPSNLQAIAHACHILKTKEDEGKAPIERIKITRDGNVVW